MISTIFRAYSYGTLIGSWQVYVCFQLEERVRSISKYRMMKILWDLSQLLCIGYVLQKDRTKVENFKVIENKVTEALKRHRHHINQEKFGLLIFSL